MKRTLGVVLVFLFGCATGGVSTQLVPKANAQQAIQLTRWEYACRSPQYAGETATALANQFGAEGWELAVVDRGVYCFKRPKL